MGVAMETPRKAVQGQGSPAPNWRSAWAGRCATAPGDRVIREVRAVEEAGPASLSFLANPRYRAKGRGEPGRA